MQTKDIFGLPLDGAKFAERYAITPNQFYIEADSAGHPILHYPDSLPAPGSVVIDAPDEQINYESAHKFKSGTTTNNTPVLGAFLKLPENCQAKICAVVMARQGANQKQFELKVAATRGTGNASLIGTVVNQSWGSPTWTATLVASGQGVAVQVTGANGVTITWAGKISFEAAVL